jgi:hypothetical protein
VARYARQTLARQRPPLGTDRARGVGGLLSPWRRLPGAIQLALLSGPYSEAVLTRRVISPRPVISCRR